MGQYFDTHFGKYGDHQIHLWLLATRPAFRRRGAATRLCQWGLEWASQRALHTTVLASPMGMHLYGGLGFTTSGSFLIQADGEEEKLELWAMVHASHREGWSVISWFLRLLAYCEVPSLRG